MFTTIRKHQTWLWALIIAAVIVSFVIYFTPGSGDGRSGAGRADYGTINGRPITRKEYFEAYTGAQLAFFLRYNRWPDPGEARRAGFSLERQARDRMVLLDRIRELKIKPGESAVAEWVVDTFGGRGQEAAAKSRYDNLLRVLRRRYHVTEANFQNFIEHQIAINHLASIAGTTGRLVTPRAAGDVYREAQEKIDADAVAFSASDYAPSVTLDAPAVAQFYTNRQSVYRFPERVQIEYVRFALSNYFSQADAELAKNTNLAADIDQAYLASNKSMFTDTNGQALPPDAAKERIREQLRHTQALVEAHKTAISFATELEALKPAALANLERVAAAKNLPTVITEPFSEAEGPRGLNVRQNFMETAFRLTPQEPLAISPIRADDAVYLIGLKQRLPSEIPALETIRAKVESDFRQDTASRLAREAGTNFIARLTNDLAQGKTFASSCAEAKVTPIKLPTFSPATRPTAEWDRRIDLGQAKAAVAGVVVGRASRLMPARDGAFVLYVRARTPVPDAELKQELPKFLANLRQAEQYEAFNDWFRRQIEVSHIDTYLGKPEQEQVPEPASPE